VPSSCVVTVTEQLPLESVQLAIGLNVSPFAPISDDVNERVPAGVDDPVPAVSATVTDTVLEAPVVTEVGFSVTVTDVDRAEMLTVVLIADVRLLLDAVTV
jgi:hypothetical protein